MRRWQRKRPLPLYSFESPLAPAAVAACLSPALSGSADVLSFSLLVIMVAVEFLRLAAPSLARQSLSAAC